MVNTKCPNGYLTAGDLVLSTEDDDYACLVGRVLDIIPLGSPNHNTGNTTDDVYVDFTGDYGARRVREIEETFSGLYGETKTMDDIPLDLVIMDPGCLIRITGIDDKTLALILQSSEYASFYVYDILRRQLDGPGEASPDRPGMRPVRGSYWTAVDGVRKEVAFENGLFHMWGSESTEYENGAVADTVAIVELPDGAVRTVYPNKLSFIRVDEAGD